MQYRIEFKNAVDLFEDMLFQGYTNQQIIKMYSCILRDVKNAINIAHRNISKWGVKQGSIYARKKIA